MVVFVRNINVEHHFRIGGLLQPADRFLCRGILRQRKELRRHDAAGGILRVLENIGDFGGILGLHQGQNVRASIFREESENVGDVVGTEAHLGRTELESQPDEALLGAVTHRGLSVRQTEELARRLKQPPPQPDPAGELATEPAANPVAADRQDSESERIEAELRTVLGTKVSLTRSRKGGRIVIEYYDDADLNRLYERLVGGAA
jgi:hypothetical protein